MASRRPWLPSASHVSVRGAATSSSSRRISASVTTVSTPLICAGFMPAS